MMIKRHTRILLIAIMLILASNTSLFAWWPFDDTINSQSGSTDVKTGKITGKGTINANDVKGGRSFRWLYEDDNGKLYEVMPENPISDTPSSEVVGVRYYNAANKPIGDPVIFSEEASMISKIFKIFSGALNQITFRMVMGMHPFPNIMMAFYSPDLVDSVLSGDLNKVAEKIPVMAYDPSYLLINSNYYANKMPTTPGDLSQWQAVGLTDDYSLKSEEGSQQFLRWSTITVIFLTCFVGEVLFTAIYGYATGDSEKDSSLLKSIAKKATISLALFILVASLPFIVEASRQGLFTIGRLFCGAAFGSIDPNSIVTKNGATENLFSIPGMFISEMAPLFGGTSTVEGRGMFEQMFAPLKQKDGEKWYGFIVTLVIEIFTQLFLLIFRIFMFFSVCKAAVHIIRNILELYLLLGCAMILTPFSIFQPTKTIGAKCIMSLLTNLIECFILFVMILVVVPAAKSTVMSTIQMLNGNLNTDTIVLPFEKRSESVEAKKIWVITYGHDTYVDSYPGKIKMFGTTNGVSLVARLGIKGHEKVVSWEWTMSDGEGNKIDPQAEFGSIRKAEGVQVYVDVSNQKAHIIEKSDDLEIKGGNIIIKDGTVIDKDGTLADYVIPVKDIAANIKGGIETIFAVTGVRTGWREGLNRIDEMERMAGIIRTVTPLIEGFTTPFQYGDVWILDGEDSYITMPGGSWLLTPGYNKTEIMMQNIALIFLGIYLPCYFIQQSTQMSNALMNGTAGMESIGNAMSNSIGGAVKTFSALAATGIGVSSKAGFKMLSNAIHGLSSKGGNNDSGGSGGSPNEKTVAGQMISD